MSRAKSERMLNLVAELLHTARPLTADELQERVPGYPSDKDSFKRSFERDKADLRETGVPIRVEPVPGRNPPEDGYRIDPSEYYVPDPGLDPDERAALHLAVETVRLDELAAFGGLHKLGVTESAGASGPTATATLTGDRRLAAAFAAVNEHRRARFRYSGRDREVDPFRLRHERGRWYLQAVDLGAGEPRAYRLDRFESDLVVGDAGSATSEVDLGANPLQLVGWSIGGEEPVTAEVALSAAQARVQASALGALADLTWREDGTAVLRLEVRNRDAFRTYVLGMLDDAEVLAPPDLRAEMVKWLEDLAGPRTVAP